MINKIVYKAEIETNNDTKDLSTKVYFGISETEFKYKHSETGHTKMIPNFWNTFGVSKDENKDFDIKWSILKKSSGYSIISKSCNLCLLEKLVVCNFKEKDRLLNKRVDLESKCQHENKYMLINYSGIN